MTWLLPLMAVLARQVRDDWTRLLDTGTIWPSTSAGPRPSCSPKRLTLGLPKYVSPGSLLDSPKPGLPH